MIDFFRSPLKMPIKIASLPFLHIEMASSELSEENILVCLKSSYKSKPHVYRQIAKQLSAQIALVTFSFKLKAYGNYNQYMRVSESDNIYIWSDVQLIARFLLYKLARTSGNYTVYQHGRYDYSDESLFFTRAEWLFCRSPNYIVWSLKDRSEVLRDRPKLQVEYIGTPEEPSPKRVDGFGFATRGPEYILSDLKLLLRYRSTSKSWKVIFHPAYSWIKKQIFVVSASTALDVEIGSNIEIPKSLLTKSLSTIDRCEGSGVEIITEADK